MTLKIRTEVELTAYDILDCGDDDAIIDLIKDVDHFASDWDFTTKLYNYFKEQMDMKDKDV